MKGSRRSLMVDEDGMKTRRSHRDLHDTGVTRERPERKFGSVRAAAVIKQ